MKQRFVSREELAYLLKLSPRRINQLSADGIVSKLSHGKYRLFESVQGYFFYLYDGWNLFDVEMPSFENLNEELDAIKEIPDS